MTTVYPLDAEQQLPTCPHCGSVSWHSDTDYIPANEADEPYYDDSHEKVYIRSRCHDCGKVWHEEWKLVKIHVTEERP